MFVSKSFVVQDCIKYYGTSYSHDTDYTFSKENGVVYLSDGTDTINVTSSAFTKLYEIRGSTDGQIKNIKVKPL